MPGRPSAPRSFAELHCHTNFSFLDGASAADELVDRAVELGLSALAVTDHQGLYGVVRFATAAHDAGIHPVIGLELELLDPFVADPARIVVPALGRRAAAAGDARADRPGRPCPVTCRTAGCRFGRDRSGPGCRVTGPPSRRISAGSVRATRAAPRPPGPRPDRLSEPVPARQPGEPGRDEGRAAVHPGAARRPRRGTRGAVGLSRRRDRPTAPGRRPRRGPGGRRGLRPAVRPGFGSGSGSSSGSGSRPGARRATGVAAAGFVLELEHHLLPDDDWLVAETARLAEELGLPVVVTNDVHYALPEGRELQDVVTAIRHGRAVGTLADLRRPDGESYLKSGEELMRLPPGDPARPPTTPDGPGVGRGDRGGRRAGGRLRGRPRVRGLPLSGL